MPPATAQDLVIDVIQLQNRPATEIVTLVQPFVGKGGTVVASGSKLIVKTTANNLQEIHSLIDQLDKGLAQLQISVLQSNTRTLAELNARATVYGQVSNHNSSINLRGNYYQTDTKEEGGTTQKIQTLEGKAAHIQVGQAFPVPEVSGYGPFNTPTAGIRYKQATTGFAVTPRLAGNHVVLDIAPWSNRAHRLGGGVIQTQSAHSTIRATLGQWVYFAGQNDDSINNSRGLAHSYRGKQKRAMKIFIKVDRMR